MCYFAIMTPQDTTLLPGTTLPDTLLSNSNGSLLDGNGVGYPHAPLMGPHTSDWVFLILTLTLVGIAILLYNFNRRFKQSIQSFFQFYSLHQLSREGNFMTERVGLILYSIFLICLSMFTYQANFFLSDGYIFSDRGIPLFIKILLGYTLFFTTKSGIYFFSGRIFETREASYYIVLDDFLISCINGLILLPILFITTYSPSVAVFYIGIGLLCITFIYRLVRAVAIGLNVSQFSLFYLFLYLCSLEIVPVMVIAKLLFEGS